MNQQHIYTLIQKYRDNTATAAEKEELLQWYRQTAYQDADFPEMEDSVGESMLARLNGEIKPAKTSAPYVRWLAAASVILLLGVTGLLISRAIWPAENTANTTAFNNILPGSNKAILTLANGTRISLSDAVNGTISNQHGIHITKAANGQLIYTIKATTEAGSEALTAFNTIETPRGGQYQIVLPDGSKVWLNASSSLKFPVNFSLHKERRVALAGEAYFEVAHNKQKAFIVYTGEIATKVLGTHFNIRAYEDELDVKVALLSGKVEILGKASDGKDKWVLSPKEVAIFKKADQSLAVLKTDEIDQYAHWRKENIVFNQTPLNEVVTRLQQVYRVKIVLDNKNLQSCKITGSFGSKNGIDAILKSICLSIEGKYSMEKDQIRIEGVGCGSQ